jgi:hypothetical protein
MFNKGNPVIVQIWFSDYIFEGEENYNNILLWSINRVHLVVSLSNYTRSILTNCFYSPLLIYSRLYGITEH